MHYRLLSVQEMDCKPIGYCRPHTFKRPLNHASNLVETPITQFYCLAVENDFINAIGFQSDLDVPALAVDSLLDYFVLI